MTSIQVAFDPIRNYMYATTPATGPYKSGLVAWHVLDNCTIVNLWNTAVINPDASSTCQEPFTSPVIANGVVYFGTGSQSQYYAIDADTGKILWVPTESFGPAFVPPTIIDGQIFIVDFNGMLWRYNLPPKPTPVPITVKPTAKPTKTPTKVPIKTPTFNPTKISTMTPTFKPSKFFDRFPFKVTTISSSKTTQKKLR